MTYFSVPVNKKYAAYNLSEIPAGGTAGEDQAVFFNGQANFSGLHASAKFGGDSGVHHISEHGGL